MIKEKHLILEKMPKRSNTQNEHIFGLNSYQLHEDR